MGAGVPRTLAMTPVGSPTLATMRFSLNGVSMIRAYESRRTVFEGLMLYATPKRGSAWPLLVNPRYKSPRIPTLHDQFPFVIVSWTYNEISLMSVWPWKGNKLP